MLTKTDLKQIGKVVREEIKIEIEPLGEKIENLDKKLSTKIEVLDKKVDKVQEDIGVYLNHLEPRVTIAEKRMDNIEEHLNFPKQQ